MQNHKTTLFDKEVTIKGSFLDELFISSPAAGIRKLRFCSVDSDMMVQVSE